MNRYLLATTLAWLIATGAGLAQPPVKIEAPSVLPAQATVPATPIGAGADGGLFNSLPPTPPPPPPIWSGSTELGLNGASGNANLFNFRFGINAERKVTDNIFTTDFLYTYTENEGVTTVQQALWNARDEILFAGTPWSLFGAINLEYDELRAYNFRVGLYAGVGYLVVDNETTTFKLRAGAGAVRELGTGNLEDRWVPEMVFGYDFKYKISDRGSFLSVMDLYPRIDDFSQFRLRVRLGYEHILDPERGLILRTGLQNRYDSDPGNAKRNDLTYFVTLGMKF
ncbi:MAG: DUF481 domain-containing protein [Fimbriiglobus sp.]